MKESPLVTVVVPSLNQGRFIADALESILSQRIPLELVLMDGGSEDQTVEVIRKYESALLYWQSIPDGGQAAAINAGMMHGSAPFVCWINSDDFLYPGALTTLLNALKSRDSAPFAYGNAWHVNEFGRRRFPYLTLPYQRDCFANYCSICQPATLIRRVCWEAVGGLDERLDLAFDYDMWFRLVENFGNPAFVSRFLAANRMHNETKTSSRFESHYDEACEVVMSHYGRLPLKWSLMRRVMRGVRSIARYVRSNCSEAS